MRKKLLLINPVNQNKTGLSLNPGARFPPIGLGIVAQLTPKDWIIEILDENFDRFQFEEADLVGLTSFTANITRAYEIAGIYRQYGIPTVIGGIHVSMLPEEAIKYVDTVVIGEAESTWPRLISDFLNGKLEKIYEKDRTSASAMSRARHDLFNSRYIFGSIQTSRGCPMDCDFCSVTVFNGRSYRQRDINDVLDELECIPQKLVYFVDDNIYGYGANASKRALALFKGIIDRGIRKDWISQASINLADDDEVLETAAMSGCRMILLGIEAESDNALHDAGKKLNRKYLARYQEVFQRINEHGIAVWGSFIYGIQHDTPETLNQRTNYILNNNVDVIQISIMTPLPGTHLYKKYKDSGRLLFTNYPDDWDRYNMQEVVFKPSLMESGELFDEYLKAGFAIYNLPNLWYKYLKTLSTTKKLCTANLAYSANLIYYNTALGCHLQHLGTCLKNI